MNRPWKIGEANHNPPRRSTANSTDTGTRLGPTQPENLFHNSPSDTAISPACPMAVDQILHHERRSGRACSANRYPWTDRADRKVAPGRPRAVNSRRTRGCRIGFMVDRLLAARGPGVRGADHAERHDLELAEVVELLGELLHVRHLQVLVEVLLARPVLVEIEQRGVLYPLVQVVVQAPLLFARRL